MTSNARIASIEIDEKSLAPAGPDAEHERKVAIFDLIESNSFKVINRVADIVRNSEKRFMTRMKTSTPMDKNTDNDIITWGRTVFRGNSLNSTEHASASMMTVL
jgi:uncharacterized protein (UPF0262 family)